MKRRHSEIEDEDLILSDDEAEELEQDLRAFLQSRGKGRPERVLQNDVPALKAKLEDIKLMTKEGNPMGWAETLVIETDEPLVVPDVNDDLARETLIYNQTLANVIKGLALCEEHGVKFKRPEDYYAEMLKTDDHMLKLKDHLLAEKRRKDERNKIHQERQMKKYAKKVQVETILHRQKRKAEDLAVVKEWRRKQKRAGSNKEEEFPEELLDPKNPKRREILSKTPVKAPTLQKNARRKAKDAKYGNGGAKRFKKDNDAASSADMSGFSKRKNNEAKAKAGFPSYGQKKSGGFGARPKKVATKRPGKDARRKH